MSAKRMPNIAIVSSLSGLGGTERSLLSFLQAMPSDKYKVDLLVFGSAGPLIKEVPSWVNIQQINEVNSTQYVQSAVKKRQMINVLSGVAKWMRLRLHWKKHKTDTMGQYRLALHLYDAVAEKYDAVISWFVPNSVQTVYSINCVNAAKKILWIHMDVQKDPMPPDALNVFSQYDKIYCVSKACKNAFDEKYPSCSPKTEVSYNVLDVQRIKERGNQTVALDNQGKFIIVTCGRIAYEKQPFFAVEIAKQLIKESRDNFVWYFVGGGPLYEEFQNRIEENKLQDHIVLLGIQQNPYAYVQKADLYVQMSLHESYCLTLAEAQILGIPAVTTNFPSAYEIVKDGETGFVVENEWIRIFDKIKALMDSPAEIMKLRDTLKNYILESNGSADALIDFIDGDLM